MRLLIEHETRLCFPAPVREHQCELRLAPRDDETQRRLSCRIEVEPRGRGTRITQSFRVQRAPWLLDRIYARMIPGHQDRDARLEADLVRLGEVAGQGSAP